MDIMTTFSLIQKKKKNEIQIIQKKEKMTMIMMTKNEIQEAQ